MKNVDINSRLQKGGALLEDFDLAEMEITLEADRKLDQFAGMCRSFCDFFEHHGELVTYRLRGNILVNLCGHGTLVGLINFNNFLDGE